VLGCIHIDTGMGPGIRMWVIMDTNLHIFQWQLFTLLQVPYEYGLYWCGSFQCGCCF